MNFTIKDYLKKFEKLLPLESKIRNVVIQSVQEVCGIPLVRQKISHLGRVVFISGLSASMKSEIVLRQEKILKRMKEIDPTITLNKIQ